MRAKLVVVAAATTFAAVLASSLPGRHDEDAPSAAACRAQLTLSQACRDVFQRRIERGLGRQFDSFDDAIDALGAAEPDPARSNDRSPAATPRRGRNAVVVRVVDGDTILVELGGDLERVRLIGIDTPETKRPDAAVDCGGPEATRAMRALLAPGVSATLLGDRSQDAVDGYGRTLAYVEHGDRDIGRELLAEGVAEVYIYREESPFERLPSYRRVERLARDQHRGNWRRCHRNHP